jgi:hypothetical protein
MSRLDVALWILGHPLLFGAGLSASVALAFALGRRLGRREPGSDEDRSFGVLEGAVFALLGLLFAFTFSSAASRFDQRRNLIVAEANAISTARLRVDLVPADLRQPLLEAFEGYIEARVASNAEAIDPAGYAEAFRRTEVFQRAIWQQTMEAGRRLDALPAVNQQLVPALNSMFDIATTRTMAMATHAPPALMLSLWIAALFATAIAGYSSGSISRVRMLSVCGYATMIALTLYLIVDFEYPRAGLIRVDAFDAVIRSQLTTAGREGGAAPTE